MRDANRGELGKNLIIQADTIMRQEWRRLNTHQSLLPGDEIIASVPAPHAGHIPKNTNSVTIDLHKHPNRPAMGAHRHPPDIAPKARAKKGATGEIHRLYIVGVAGFAHLPNACATMAPYI